MKRNLLLGLGLAVVSSAGLMAQIALPPGASPQAPQHPDYQKLIATCKTPPPAQTPRAGGAAPAAGRAGGPAAPPAPAAAPAQPAAFPPPPAEYTVAEIPGVIAAGQRWTQVWQTSGNNADGILAADDGGLLIAQNHNSQVVKLDARGMVTTVHRDTHTGGGLSRSPKGELFIVQRGLRQSVSRLEPSRRVLADKLPNGDPLDCLGGVINDVTADRKGGVYFTMGGLFHVNAQGVVTRYGENLSTNGVILSADEKTLYVTNGAFGGPSSSIAAFDVQPDGSLSNQRAFVTLPSGGGDGLTIDAENRLYVTAGPNLFVVAPDGKLLGRIPAPYGLITAAFAGPDKKTMYAVSSLIDANRLQHAFVFSIPMVAQGYKGRAK